MFDRYRAGRVLLDRQRAECCAVLKAVPPDAPTLCEGWTAFDLAVHLELLCRGPLSWPAMALPFLAGSARRRVERLQGELGYSGVVRRLRHRSPWIALFLADPLQGWRHHLGEWFVHTEDVRRANHLPQAAIEPDLAEALWQRVQPAARILHRHSSRGLTLRTDDGREALVVQGPDPVLVAGEPGELMVWTYRRRMANVTIT